VARSCHPLRATSVPLAMHVRKFRAVAAAKTLRQLVEISCDTSRLGRLRRTDFIAWRMRDPRCVAARADAFGGVHAKIAPCSFRSVRAVGRYRRLAQRPPIVASGPPRCTISPNRSREVVGSIASSLGSGA
jgi:hypothetical protein